MKERMSGDVNKRAERAGRGCIFHVPSAPHRGTACPLRQYKVLLRTSSAEPSRTSCPCGLDIHTAWLGRWGRAGEEGRSGAGAGGGNLKIVPISFLQLSFTVRKQARGLPAPVHTMPYIMGDTWASLQAGNRQGRDIYAALPKLMSSSREPRPWKQPLGWGKQLSRLTGAPQKKPLGWGGAEGEQSAGFSVWAASRKQAGAAVGLLGEMAVGRGRVLWGGLGEMPQQVPRGDCSAERKMWLQVVEEGGCRGGTGKWRKTGFAEHLPRRIRNREGASRRGNEG